MIADDGLLRVFRRSLDAVHGAQVIVGVDRFGRGRSPDSLAAIGKPSLSALTVKSQIFAVGLRFTGKRFLEIVHGFAHMLPPHVEFFTMLQVFRLWP
jgi:hypothetical protein